MYTNGCAAATVRCLDVVIKNLNNEKTRTASPLLRPSRGAANSGHDEVCFHSHASVSGENDSFVKYNPVTGERDYSLEPAGRRSCDLIQVTAWLDQNIRYPIRRCSPRTEQTR
jgi:hypothetical protein